jgi:hypothetical protein
MNIYKAKLSDNTITYIPANSFAEAEQEFSSRETEQTIVEIKIYVPEQD